MQAHTAGQLQPTLCLCHPRLWLLVMLLIWLVPEADAVLRSPLCCVFGRNAAATRAPNQGMPESLCPLVFPWPKGMQFFCHM